MRRVAEERAQAVALQTVASAAVAAKLPVVALWMVHLECFVSAGLGRLRLFVQGLAPEARPGKRCPNFAWAKVMEALSRGFQPPETTLPIVLATDSPV